MVVNLMYLHKISCSLANSNISLHNCYNLCNQKSIQSIGICEQCHHEGWNHAGIISDHQHSPVFPQHMSWKWALSYVLLLFEWHDELPKGEKSQVVSSPRVSCTGQSAVAGHKSLVSVLSLLSAAAPPPARLSSANNYPRIGLTHLHYTPYIHTHIHTYTHTHIHTPRTCSRLDHVTM